MGAAKADRETAIALTTETIAYVDRTKAQTHAVRYPVGRAGHEILADERDIDAALDELHRGLATIVRARKLITRNATEEAEIGALYDLLTRLRRRCDDERRSLGRADSLLQTIVLGHDHYRDRLIARNRAICAGASLDAAEAAMPELRECNECPAQVEVQMVDFATDTGPSYEPVAPGALKCAGCGEIVCRDCARTHPAPLACAAEVRAWQRARIAMVPA